MKIAITGSHGLIGSALVANWRASGHEVIRLVRQESGPGELRWDPAAGRLDASGLAGVSAVVHLAGAGVGDHRWSPAYKKVVLSSRVDGTLTLARALASLAEPPKVLLSGSAIGYYGVRDDEDLTERSEPGMGYLAGVCAQWEAATAPAEAAGVRVVHLRTGVVLSAAGGALKKQLPIFRCALGGRLGSGRQQFSWISRRDVVAAISFLMADEELSGAVNVASPAPVSNAEFTRQLSRAVHRPARLVVPTSAFRLVFGAEMTEEFFLASQRVIPQRLTEAGFTFADPDLAGALETALGDRVVRPA